MAITVKYFAVLREQAGKSEEVVAFQEGMTITDVWSRAMGTGTVPEDLMVAVNMEYTRKDADLKDGDEIAFFPAVTGG